MKKIYTILCGSFLMLQIGMTQPAEIEPNNPVIKFEKIVDGLKNPWGMEFLPTGEILVTEKEGQLRIIRNRWLLESPIGGLPELYVRGQGGLMDIKLHPDFEKNKWIYLTYSSSDNAEDGGNTTVARFKFNGKRLSNKQVLYKAKPDSKRGAHFGSRLEFDDEGYLYFSIGDRFNRDENPQDIKRDGGKIYRIHDDGSIPNDNPFINTANARQAIYSYGHRNPQGMAKQPGTGKIWTHEHGPQGGDEINIIKAGVNYGWPLISYGINYNGTTFTEETEREGMEQPVSYWVPSIAPCGMTFITGNKYPGWEGDLIVGSLKFNYLVHVKVEGDKVISQEIIAKDIGRVRNVKQGPDGYIYVGIEGSGLYRLTMEE